MIRIDRAISVHLMQPWCKRRGIPILMYHSVSDISSARRHPYYELHTPVRVFEEHLDWLACNGYQALHLNHLASSLAQDPTQNFVVITFDDGFRDFYTSAFPVLKKYGFTATVFLPTAYIANHRQQFLGKECMTWDEVRELHQAGIEFGSHTVSHPFLYDLTDSRLEKEIAESKKTIEEELISPVASFSHPYAFPADSTYSARLRALLVKHGYATGVCTTLGTANSSSDPYFLRRLPINGFDDPVLFQAKLEGAYDWLGILQSMKKSISRKNQHG